MWTIRYNIKLVYINCCTQFLTKSSQLDLIRDLFPKGVWTGILGPIVSKFFHLKSPGFIPLLIVHVIIEDKIPLLLFNSISWFLAQSNCVISGFIYLKWLYSTYKYINDAQFKSSFTCIKKITPMRFRMHECTHNMPNQVNFYVLYRKIKRTHILNFFKHSYFNAFLKQDFVGLSW